MRCLRFVILAGCVLAAGRAVARDVEQFIRQADQLAREKKLDEALDAIHKALKEAPDNELALFVAAQIERRAGRFAEGLEHSLAAIKLSDSKPVYYVLGAACAYGAHDGEQALQLVRKALAKRKDALGPEIYREARLYESLVAPATYTVTWNLDPRKGAFTGTAMQIAVPKLELPYQTTMVKVKGAASSRVVRGDVNDIVQVVPDGGKPFQVITTVKVKPTSYDARLAKSGGPLPREAMAFLGAADTFDPADPKLRKLGSELRGKTAVETVHNVQAWMQKNIEYKLEKKSVELDFKNVSELMERGHAECKGYTVLFTALCRAAGVPARTIWGVLFLPRDGGGFNSHNWVEVYIPGAGWVPLDPQQPETLGWLPATHVRVFMDLRQSSTSKENLPLYNLLYMNGEKLEYEESR
jgi:transglutaminase-like putative cysteine protease